MAWIPPKTDWEAEDSFDLYTDYFRIKNNILWLQKLIGQEYRPFGIIPMADYDFYNNVERNIDALADAGFRDPRIPPTRTWKANEPVWNHADLNRIERSLFIMYDNIMKARANRPVLSMVLGVNRYVEPKITAVRG